MTWGCVLWIIRYWNSSKDFVLIYGIQMESSVWEIHRSISNVLFSSSSSYWTWRLRKKGKDEYSENLIFEVPMIIERFQMFANSPKINGRINENSMWIVNISPLMVMITTQQVMQMMLTTYNSSGIMFTDLSWTNEGILERIEEMVQRSEPKH